MRLTCPNCGAQYEVPDEVIPESGRDVQCSNCGETWFQQHPAHAEAGVATAPDPAGGGDRDWAEPDEDQGPEPAAATAEPPPPSERPQLDPGIARVLREEAKREARARDKEARGGLETQADLGLDMAEDDDDRRSHQARARMARLQGKATTQEDFEADDIDAGSRRDFLPDIDDINSTISAGGTSDYRDTSARDGTRATQPVPRGGFGRGLRLAILLAIIATALYLFAGRIGEAMPALASPLAAYAEAVDGLRAMLNEQVYGLLK